jgi:vanillate O-demethylase ferredoxin subunit
MSSTEDCLDVLVLSRTEAATGIVALELVALDGGALPAFDAGAHVDVHVAPGIVRQYSLCNDPVERHRYRLGILLDPSSRGGSAEIHRVFAAGRRIRISRPRCHFHLVPQSTRSILVAGGIGITPLLAMAYRLQAEGADFTLHYCTRSADRAAFAAELAASGFASKVQLHHDDGPAEQRFRLDNDLPPAAPGTHLYVCGPGGFINFVTGGAKQAGWDAGNVHVEHFAAEVTTAGAGFTVVAATSGVTVQVGEGQTVAQALIAAGVDVQLSCEQGVCGTCLTRVIEGTPDQRDLYQTDDEKAANTHMTPCCSRSLSARLVLEI